MVLAWGCLTVPSGRRSPTALIECGIESGDRIVLYTDGITEAFSPEDEEWGDKRFIEFQKTTSALDTDACADALIDVLGA